MCERGLAREVSPVYIVPFIVYGHIGCTGITGIRFRCINICVSTSVDGCRHVSIVVINRYIGVDIRAMGA